jgi:ferritin-like metal-binding protein YciE
MQGSGVTVVEHTSQFFPLGVQTFHSRFKQGLLNIARHVAPNVHSRPPHQAREAFQSVSHCPSEMRLLRKEPRTGLGVPLPSLQKEVRMGLFTKDIKTMEDLYLHVLQDIYYAENQIKKALPDMIEKATNRNLTAAFKAHLEETEKQIGRLQQAFQLLGKDPKGTACPAIDGIIKEANEVAGECDNKKVLDAALIAAAQAVEHYEITRYGSMISWSEELGRDAIAKLLTTNLNEEKAADKKLTMIGEKKVNLKAAG